MSDQSGRVSSAWTTCRHGRHRICVKCSQEECPEREDGHDYGWVSDWNEEVCRGCGAER